MQSDLEKRVAHLENQLEQLEQRSSEERRRSDRRRAQEKWIRIAILIMVAGAYAVYLRQVSSIL